MENRVWYRVTPLGVALSKVSIRLTLDGQSLRILKILHLLFDKPGELGKAGVPEVDSWLEYLLQEGYIIEDKVNEEIDQILKDCEVK